MEWRYFHIRRELISELILRLYQLVFFIFPRKLVPDVVSPWSGQILIAIPSTRAKLKHKIPVANCCSAGSSKTDRVSLAFGTWNPDKCDQNKTPPN